VLSSSERNCILVVGGSQIEQEILIALVFSLGEKEDVAKVAVKAFVRSDGNRRAWNFTDFLSASKTFGNVPLEIL